MQPGKFQPIYSFAFLRLIKVIRSRYVLSHRCLCWFPLMLYYLPLQYFRYRLQQHYTIGCVHVLDRIYSSSRSKLKVIMTNGVGVMVNLPLARFGKAIARRVWRRLGKFFMLVGMVPHFCHNLPG